MRQQFTRRDFNRLTAAAFGGALAGSVVGCKPEKTEEEPQAKAPEHICRGLNACKGQGADGKNACAGQGTCATVKQTHDCAGKNACQGQGGCGETVGANDCKGKGNCAVPLTMDKAWETARANFEAKMKTEGKEVGAAPPKA